MGIAMEEGGMFMYRVIVLVFTFKVTIYPIELQCCMLCFCLQYSLSHICVCVFVLN